ncbi:Cmgc/mapk protein kinase, partial [Globisporangium splendens]
MNHHREANVSINRREANMSITRREANLTLNRRESNLTLDGEEECVVEIERIETPWMSRELFHTLWQNATLQIGSSCSFTKYVKKVTTTAAAGGSREESDGSLRKVNDTILENGQQQLQSDDQDEQHCADFRTQLLEAIGDDIVVFPQRGESPAVRRSSSDTSKESFPLTPRAKGSDATRQRVFAIYGYAGISDNFGLRTVLLIRLEQLHGSEQIAISIKNTDPLERTRMNAFMSILQQRIQPGAPPRRPHARIGDTSTLFLEEISDEDGDANATGSSSNQARKSGSAGTPPPAAPVVVNPSRGSTVMQTTRSRSHTVRYRNGDGISFEGYLNKKSDLLQSWKALYCVLEGETMAYYESREDFIMNTKLIGRIHIQSVEDDNMGKPNGFRILTEGHRTNHLSSRTAFEKDQWKRAITVAITKAPEAARPHIAFGSQPLDVSKFYRLLGALLRQELSDFPLLFQSIHPDVVVTSNFPPIVPFWGQYRRYDGVLLFISTLLESVEVESFTMVEVMELVRGDADCIDGFSDHETIDNGFAASPAEMNGNYTVSPRGSSQPGPLSAFTPSTWEKRLVVTGKETYCLVNHDSRRITQLFVHELWLDHKDRLVRWHMNGDSVALSVAFDDATRGENIRLVLPGETSAISQSIPPGTFYVQILRALQLHPVEQINGKNGSSQHLNSSQHGKGSGAASSSSKKVYPVYVRCILEEGTHMERTLDGLDLHSSGIRTDELSKSHPVALSEKRRPSSSTRLFRGFKRAAGISGERTFAPFGDRSGCVTNICKCSLEVDPGSDSIGTLNPQWASNLRLEFPGCARGFTYFLKLEVFQSRFMLADEIIGVCKINLTPYLSLFSGSADAKANGALPRWHNLCDQYNDCKESWAPPTVFRGRIQASVIFAPTISSADSLNDPKILGRRQSLGNIGIRTSGSELRRLNSEETLVQSLSSESLREFLRSDRLAGGGHLGVAGDSTGRFVVQSSMRSPPNRNSLSMESVESNPQESETEGHLKQLARDNHVFAAKKTVFDVPKKYHLIKVVGSGTYGEVIAASDVESGTTVAIKKITNAFAELPDTKRLLRELCLLRQLAHPNLIRLYDVLRPERLCYLEDIYLVTDLMETDLHRVIHSTQTLTDEHVAYFMRQILRALAYLHSADILHRDLKPSNVLVTSTCELKVCDLGLARYVDYTQAKDKQGASGVDHFVELTEYVVTRWYRAPEILLDGCRYDKPSDLWSAGCILAELLGRKPLFPGSSTTNQLNKIFNVLGTPDAMYIGNIHKEAAQKWLQRQRRRPKIPFTELYPNANLLAIDLLEKLLVYDPEKRITAKEALHHPYLLEAFRSIITEHASVNESVMCYDELEEKEDTFAGKIDDSHERVKEEKLAMQEAVFEQVCHFNPEALEYERLVKEHDELYCVDPVSGKLVPIKTVKTK